MPVFIVRANKISTSVFLCCEIYIMMAKYRRNMQ